MLMVTASGASDFRSALEYVRTANLKAESLPGTICAFVLDEDLYNNTNGLYSNLRIYDSTGQQVPFTVRQKFTTALRKSEKTYPARIESLIPPETDKNNRLEIIVAGPKPEIVKVFNAERITINTIATNFEKNVTVYGSADGSNWKELAAGVKIYDYSSIANLRNTEIKIPDSGCRMFKLELLNFSELKQQSGFSQLVKNDKEGNAVETNRFYERQDFKIDNIILTAKAAEQQISVPATEKINASFTETREKDGRQVFDITTSSSPVVSITIITGSQNFARDGILECSADGKTWNYLAGGKFFSYLLPGVNRSELSLPIAANRAQRYRLTLFNKDNPALQNVDIVLTAEVNHALFLSAAAQLPAKVYYGGDAIPVPQYDIQEIISRYKNLSCSELQLSLAQKNPEFKGKPSEPDKKWFNIAMYSAFVLAALALIVILAVCMRKFEQTPEQNS